MNTRTSVLIKALVALTNRFSAHDINAIMQSYSDSIEKRIATRGKKEAVRYYKEMHAIAIQIATKQSDFIVPSIGTKTDKRGIPKTLSILKPLLESSNMVDVRGGLTISRFYESIVIEPSLDLEPIVTPGPTTDEAFKTDFSQWCEKGVKKTFGGAFAAAGLPQARVLMSTKNGPNGPAVVTSHLDAIGIIQDEAFLTVFEKYCLVSGNMPWYHHMVAIAHLGSPRVESKDYKIGKISLIPEAGGKTRTIAISDYWTQTLLYPLHNKLMLCLKGLKTDGTYTQDDSVKRIIRNSGGDTYCFDLSSATDRFPVGIQEILLSKMTTGGENFSKAGSQLMTERFFSSPNGEKVKWACGQPLGLYSSGAMFALTHHAIIEYLAFKKGYKSFRKYQVLGDDVAIWDKDVALAYQDFMTEYGITINKSKSMISEPSHHRVEFAKRIAYNGVEITGLKFTALVSGTKNIFSYFDLLKLMKIKGGNFSWADVIFPPHLSKSSRERLSALLWGEVKDISPLNGVGSPYTSQISSRVLPLDIMSNGIDGFREFRLDSLIQKALDIQHTVNRHKGLSELLRRTGMIDSPEAYATPSGSLGAVHPLVLVYKRLLIESAEARDKIEAMDRDELVNSDLLPVEYLPIPTMEPFFADKKNILSTRRGIIVSAAFKHAVNYPWTTESANKAGRETSDNTQ